MHGDVRTPLAERHLQFLDEQALAAHFRERAIEHPVALRAHRYQLDREAGMRVAQPRGDVFGLPEREFAASGRDAY